MLDLAFAFLAAVAVIGWSLLLSLRLRWPIGGTILPTACLLLTVLAVSLPLGVYGIARVAIVGGGLVALVVCLWRFRDGATSRLAAPSGVLFLAGVAVIGLVNVNTVFTSWDAFSFWGKVAKFIALTGTYPTPATYSGFLDYPFGLAAFEGLFLIPGRFSEPAAVVAIAVLALGCGAALIERATWRDWWVVACLSALLVGGSYLLELRPWNSILPDRILGLMAGAGLAIYWRGCGEPKSIVLLLPLFLALPLIKDVGTYLAVTLLVLTAVDQVMRLATGQPVSKSIAALGAAIIALAGVRAMWTAHVAAIGAGPTFRRDVSFILDRLGASDFGSTVVQVLETFVDRLATAPIALSGLPIWLWLAGIVLVAAVAVAVTGTRQNAARIVMANIVLAVMGAVYLAGLLALYLFSFSAFEATRAASFERYVGIYLLFWLFGNITYLAGPWRDRGPRALGFGVLTLMAFAALSIPIRDVIGQAPAKNMQMLADMFRRQQERLTIATIFKDGPSGSIYFIWTGTTGSEYYMAAYELVPSVVNSAGCFSLGPPRFVGDVWSCDLPLEQFAERVRDRDYVAIGRTDDIFWDLYGSLFDEGSRESGAVWFAMKDGLLTPARKPARRPPAE